MILRDRGKASFHVSSSNKVMLQACVMMCVRVYRETGSLRLSLVVIRPLLSVVLGPGGGVVRLRALLRSGTGPLSWTHRNEADESHVKRFGGRKWERMCSYSVSCKTPPRLCCNLDRCSGPGSVDLQRTPGTSQKSPKTTSTSKYSSSLNSSIYSFSI